MKIDVFASGSKANCTLIRENKTKILIDVGLNFTLLRNIFEERQIDIKDISAILITHCHNDHICGLSSLVKKYHLKVYIPLGMFKEINRFISKEDIIFIEDSFDINEFKINLLYTSHDVQCSVGYIINCQGKELVYITDTGYLNKRILSRLNNKDIYIIESNHDETMLMNGNYPLILKQRILSDYGHLSNKVVSKYMEEVVGTKTKYIVLAHLSENNNTEALAYNTMKNTLTKIGFKPEKIIVAKQYEMLETIEV